MTDLEDLSGLLEQPADLRERDRAEQAERRARLAGGAPSKDDRTRDFLARSIVEVEAALANADEGDESRPGLEARLAFLQGEYGRAKN